MQIPYDNYAQMVSAFGRPIDEQFNTQMDVEQDPCGAHAAIHHMQAEIARLTDERDAAIKAMCEAAKAKGQAEGKLAASEMAGVVEGWKTRAEKAEAERDKAVAAAYEAAAKICDGTAKYHMSDPDDIEVVRLTAAEIRSLTPADASAALVGKVEA